MSKQSTITRTVFFLGMVSLFTDMASEMIYPGLPLFLDHNGITVIGSGLLEGIAKATAGLSRSYFGRWSDLSLRRLPFVQVGYGLSALSKPLLAFHFSIGLFVDNCALISMNKTDTFVFKNVLTFSAGIEIDHLA